MAKAYHFWYKKGSPLNEDTARILLLNREELVDANGFYSNLAPALMSYVQDLEKKIPEALYFSLLSGAPEELEIQVVNQVAQEVVADPKKYNFSNTQIAGPFVAGTCTGPKENGRSSDNFSNVNGGRRTWQEQPRKKFLVAVR